MCMRKRVYEEASLSTNPHNLLPTIVSEAMRVATAVSIPCTSVQQYVALKLSIYIYAGSTTSIYNSGRKHKKRVYIDIIM